MSEVERDEDGESDVSGEKAGGGKFAGEEDLEAVGEGEKDEEDECDPRGVGLEGGCVGAGVEDVVEDEGFAEALGMRAWLDGRYRKRLRGGKLTR